MFSRIKINVFLNSTDDFFDQPIVADGASNLLRKIFKNYGDHARSAVSCNSLPKNIIQNIIFNKFRIKKKDFPKKSFYSS